MTKKIGRGRARLEITDDVKKEVDEIINLKIKELNGFRGKLTFNNVWEFNKKIANNTDYLNSKGETFNQYSSDFWSVKYKNVDNYGRKRVLFFKNEENVETTFNGEFNPDIQDMVLAVQELHNKPERLIRSLEKMYSEKTDTIKTLQASNDELRAMIEKQNTLIKNMEQAMYNVFFASRDSRNSLQNVMDLKKSKDWFIKEELEGLVGSRSDFLELIKPQDEQPKIVPMKKKRLSAKEQGF